MSPRGLLVSVDLPPCPRCTADVEGITFDAGRRYDVEVGPLGRPDTIFLRGDEPDPTNLPPLTGPKPWPDGDIFRLTPCGDQVTREEAEAVYAAARAQTCQGRLQVTAEEFQGNPVLAIDCPRCHWAPEHYGGLTLDALTGLQRQHDTRKLT